MAQRGSLPPRSKSDESGTAPAVASLFASASQSLFAKGAAPNAKAAAAGSAAAAAPPAAAKYSPTFGPKKKAGPVASPLSLEAAAAPSASVAAAKPATQTTGTTVLSAAQLSAQFQAAQNNRNRGKARHVQELMHEQDQQMGVEADAQLAAAAAAAEFAVADALGDSTSEVSESEPSSPPMSAVDVAAFNAAASTLSATAAAFQPTTAFSAPSPGPGRPFGKYGANSSDLTTFSPSPTAHLDGDSCGSLPTVCHLALSSDTPVEACALKLHVIVREPTGARRVIADEDDDSVKCRWLRSQKRVCAAAGCRTAAKMQCVPCAQQLALAQQRNQGRGQEAALEQLTAASYFCSQECLMQGWPQHKQMHARASQAALASAGSPAAVQTPWSCNDCDDDLSMLPEPEDQPDISTVRCRFPQMLANSWSEAASTRVYTPTPDDVGRTLRFEVTPMLPAPLGAQALANIPAANLVDGFVHGPRASFETQPTLAAPMPPPPRVFTYCAPPETHGHTAGSPFKVVCYNILAEIYATRQIYPYCPVWALAWNYRRNNILRELLSYDADLICLQEVQGDHFENFFQPRLATAGFDGVFKPKTRDAMGDNPNAIDGCAIFFRRERFALTEQYSIEFNEAARQHIERNPHLPDKKSALRRLMKGNVALVVVLEELDNAPPSNSSPAVAAATVVSKRNAAGNNLLAGVNGMGSPLRARRKRRLCVANTHIYWDPEYEDVKLWQTWVLCQELEKLVWDRQLPMLLCGDFNSMPDSAVYDLLSSDRRVRSDHPVFDMDVCGVLPKASMLTHRLPFASAYAAGRGEEPAYTNYTGHFLGVLDYMFFTKNQLATLSHLEVDDERLLQRHTALPSPLYSSDHIALVSEMDWLV